MRKLTLTLSSLVLALACQTLTTHASTPLTTGSSQASGGMTSSLTTSGYEFTPEIGVLLKPGGGTMSLPPQVFSAAMTVRNNSSDDMNWTLYYGVTFEFTVTNANGKVVWDSVPKVLPQFIAKETLKSGQSLHSSVSVPLFVNGRALPAGTYTLTATLFGANPVFSATTTFIVNNVIAIN